MRLELLWSRQETELIEDPFFLFEPAQTLFDIDVDYYHVGLLYQWNPGHVHPFVVGSVGVTRFDPQVSDLGSEDRFSASLGGGAKIMFGDHFGLRLEGRVFSTFFEDNEDFYCRRSCSSDENYVIQSEGRAGLIIAF